MSADSLLQQLADLVADRVVEKLRAGSNDMIEQSGSPLGVRRHCAIVRRIVASGEAGAAIVGRRHLLTREVLDAELAKCSKRNRTADVADPLHDLREKYGLEKVQ